MVNKERLVELAERWWPTVVSVALFGGLWITFGLLAAECFSIGFVTAAVLIAFEIGIRKRAALRSLSTPSMKDVDDD